MIMPVNRNAAKNGKTDFGKTNLGKPVAHHAAACFSNGGRVGKYAAGNPFKSSDDGDLSLRARIAIKVRTTAARKWCRRLATTTRPSSAIRAWTSQPRLP